VTTTSESASNAGSADTRLVRGTIRRGDGKPIDGATVTAYDRDLRKKQVLGEATTALDGRYEIRYGLETFLRAEKGSADLLVSVSSAEGSASSGIVFNAKDEETIDLVVADRRSEYARIAAAIPPLLQGQDVGLTELRENDEHQDFTFLAGETGEDAGHIELFVVAERLSLAADLLSGETHPKGSGKTSSKKRYLAAEVLYGLIRQGVPTTLPRLLAQHHRILQRALLTSRRDNVIPPSLSDQEISSALDKIRQLAVNHVLRDGPEKERTSLAVLLDLSALPKEKHARFADLYLQHQGPRKKFWPALRGDKEFKDEGVVDRLELTFELGQLTRNHLSLVRELQQRASSGQLKSLRDLAALDRTDWEALINKQVNGKAIGFPKDTPGKDDPEKVRNYAASLERMIEEAHPTAVFAARFKQRGIPGAEAIKTEIDGFFADNPAFDFRTTYIEKYFADKPSVNALPARDAIKKHLKKAQRLLKLSLRFEEIRDLLASGLDSALSITQMSRRAFVSQHSNPVPNPDLTYDLAVGRVDLAVHERARFSNQFNQATQPVVPDRPGPALPALPATVEGIPAWAELFGSLDFCGCEQCRSVYSPAAYLVDLLYTLKKTTLRSQTSDETNALTVLLDRRPDLAHTELSCQNTNTRIPYIDLVNEVLENAVLDTSATYQTTWTEEELSVQPEHVDGDAYTRLRRAVFPWSLPLDLWVEEGRAYGERLGIGRHELMRTFQSEGNNPTPSEVEIAGEYLGLVHRERGVVTGGLGLSARTYWGVDQDDWPALLIQVPELLRRSGLSHSDLQQSLDTDYVNPGGTINIQFAGSGCKLEEASVANQDGTSLDGAALRGFLRRILGFVRLWRRLGWNMWELDQAISATGSTELNESFLVELYRAQQLRADFNQSVATVVSWRGPIGTRGFTDFNTAGQPVIPSLFDQLFRNKTVVNPPDEAFANGPDSLSGGLAERSATICAALGIRAEDFALLLADPVVLADGTLTLENLSRLYRHVTLARALRLSVADLLSFRSLIGGEMFGTLELTRRFCEQVAKVRASDFTLEELRYLLRHEFSPASGIAPDPASIGRALDEVRDGLQRAAQEHYFVADPTGAVTRQELALLLPVEDLERAIAILDGSSALPLLEQEGAVGSCFSNARNPAMFLPDIEEAQTRLIGQAALSAGQQRFEYVLGHLVNYFRQGVAIWKFSATIGLDVATTQQLLTRYLRSPENAAQRAMDVFLEAGFVESDRSIPPEEQRFGPQFRAFRLLTKAATVVTRMKVSSAQLEWLFGSQRDPGWLDLNSLPTGVGQVAAPFDDWARLADVCELRDTLPAGDPILADVFRLVRDPASTRDDVLRMLEDVLGWSLEDLEVLAGERGFNLQFPDDYQGEHWLRRLERCFSLMKRLGVPADRCVSWRKPDLDEADALGIRNAAKAKHEQANWLGVARLIQDVLREKKRAGLVAYLTSRRTGGRTAPFEDAHDLFGHCLVDVEMSACQTTSRIKQAIGSVQLFIQRMLMSLEPAGTPAPDPDINWDKRSNWMKNYRIWEANRKVFLYPENWIEPELRDDKSPLFKDLEGELLQDEVAPQTVETALRHYLEKLDQVARLEIAGLYHQVEDGVNILHVFGRTCHEPYVYYYRRRIGPGYQWTAWEKVDVDVQGHHLIPVIWNRRLYLFWPIFIERTAEPETTLTVDEPDGNTEINLAKPAKTWAIQLAWSEYRNGRWSAKTQSADTFNTARFVPESWWSAKALLLNGSLAIRMYQRDAYAQFVFHEGHGKPLIEQSPLANNSPMRWPARTEVSYQAFLETSSRFDNSLYVTEGDFPLNANTLDEIAGVVYGGTDRVLLRDTPGQYRLMAPHQYYQFTSSAAFFYEDDTRTFFVRPALVAEEHDEVSGLVSRRYYPSFSTFYHPYVTEFTKRLDTHGIDGLLKWSMQDPVLQLQRNDQLFDVYQPQTTVVAPYPVEDVDVERGGAYSLYNWELFFHAPLFIADRLSKNQHFADAQRWFHYIFDPTSTDSYGSERFWKFRKFYDDTRADADGRPRPVEQLLELLHYDGEDPEIRKEVEAMQQQIAEWQRNPFNPHLIARLRTAAYQKTVVMKYLDNLIAWGDQLFRRDTIESINEATLLYILAAEILGQRPVRLPEKEHESKTFQQLSDQGLDAFADALVEIENMLPANGAGDAVWPSGEEPLLPSGMMLYFCVPPNDKLLGYWTTVANRLHKIRHCMNIEGVARQLALDEPPIDPGLLVRAAAAGVDISNALNDLNAPLPHYRFGVMLPKAVDLCNDLKSLGGALLSALEKRDAEELAVIRATQERSVLTLIEAVKKQQIDEAVKTIESLEKTRNVVVGRYLAHQKLLGKEAREPAVGETVPDVEFPHYAKIKDSKGTRAFEHELDEDASLKKANQQEDKASDYEMGANLAYYLPTITTDIKPWGIGGGIEFGGQHVAPALKAFADYHRFQSAKHHLSAGQDARKAGWILREHDWVLQNNVAGREIMQIDKQILAASVRKQIAEQELRNHETQIANAAQVEEFLRHKYSNQELYHWMISQTAAVYFSAYQLTYDVAKRAERACRHELGLAASSFIQFGYWDSLRKGLQAGEKLASDLRRMEAAYLDQNKREYEITKHISLAQLDPAALMKLKATGSCVVEVPELLFDMDYPGHYFRRVRSMSISVPCVVGPYTSVNCTLTLLANSVRVAPQVDNPSYERNRESPVTDDRFRDTLAAEQSIATSSAQNDSGVFELSFRDERYLPFEGAGAISTWQIDLPTEFNYFDVNTIADIILHLRYTARDGGADLRRAAGDFVMRTLPEEGVQLVDLRHGFPTPWRQFLQPAAGADQILTLRMSTDHFPFYARNGRVMVKRFQFIGELSDPGPYELMLTPPLADGATVTLERAPELSGFGQLHHGMHTAQGESAYAVGEWRLRLRKPGADFRSLTADEVRNLLMIVDFRVTR
jgi:hypothetical protein